MAVTNQLESPARSLTIYLLREGINAAEKALRNSGALRVIEVRIDSTKLGDLYVQQSRSHLPSWAALFEDYIDDIASLGRVNSSSAVLLVPAKSRLFALSFGQGRYLLEPGSWEERFGLRVVLNTIDAGSLRSIDKWTFDAISRHTRVQSSREAPIGDFGLDIEQDLLRAATGTTKDESYGKRLTGMDSLHAAVRMDLSELRGLLGRYLEKFNDDAYRESFPWVEHIAEVSQRDTIETLNRVLVAKVKSGKTERCWLAVPEIIDWAQISGFRYRFGSREPKYHDLHLPEFLASLPDDADLSPELLRRRHAYAIDLADERRHSWPVYQCVYCEIEHEGSTFLLSGGKWYRIEQDFVKSVNEFVKSIPKYGQQLPEYADSSEGAYCARVAKELKDKYALMDQKMVAIGGAYSKIEFCDLYTDARDLIHVKRYGASSVLSHLFSQGVVSGETFRANAGFRVAVNKLLPPAFRFDAPDQPPQPSSYRVVFAVVSDQAGDLALPFFSRVNLKHATTRLHAYGYRTAIAKVMVSDKVSTLKWYKQK